MIVLLVVIMAVVLMGVLGTAMAVIIMQVMQEGEVAHLQRRNRKCQGVRVRENVLSAASLVIGETAVHRV